MGPTRLNYSKRKLTGTELGEIAVKDIRKRAASFLEKEAKESSNPRKLVISFQGKALGDEGFLVVQEELLRLYENPALRVSELNLASSELTTKSLRVLAPLVQSADFDLEHLNLSGNRIRVTTQEEIKDWEVFLGSFAKCRSMRRLDLSSNDFSDPRAIETLLRVYCKHHRVDPIVPERPLFPAASSVDSLVDVTNELQLSSSDLSDSMSQATFLQTREGLRSIAYIILSDCDLVDAGLIHLSYLLAGHYLPQYLRPLKAGFDSERQKKEHDASECFGIVYTRNHAISPTATKVLECAQMARQKLRGMPRLSKVVDDEYDGLFETSNTCRLSGTRRRRSSTLSISELTPQNLQVYRKRLQRRTLEDETFGLKSVQLWEAAIKTWLCALWSYGDRKTIEEGDNVMLPDPYAGMYLEDWYKESIPMWLKRELDNKKHPFVCTLAMRDAIVKAVGTHRVLNSTQQTNIINDVLESGYMRQELGGKSDGAKMFEHLEMLGCVTYAFESGRDMN